MGLHQMRESMIEWCWTAARMAWLHFSGTGLLHALLGNNSSISRELVFYKVLCCMLGRRTAT